MLTRDRKRPARILGMEKGKVIDPYERGKFRRFGLWPTGSGVTKAPDDFNIEGSKLSKIPSW